MSNGSIVDPKKEGLQSAAEWLKLTLALSTGALIFGVGLVKEHIDFAPWQKALMVGAWALLGLASATGILALSAIPMMLANSNYDLEDRFLTWPARIHQGSFMLGSLALGFALAISLLHSTPSQSSSAVTPTYTIVDRTTSNRTNQENSAASACNTYCRCCRRCIPTASVPPNSR